MRKNLQPFDRVVRLILAAFFGIAAAVLMQHPLAIAAFALFAAFMLAEATVGYCWLHDRLGVHAVSDRLSAEHLFLTGLGTIQVVIAYIWWGAGFGKITSGTFPQELRGMLEFFASMNPFPWYRQFLETVAMPNAATFGYVVEWGQVAAAAGLALGIGMIVYFQKNAARQRIGIMLSCVALFGGMIMNVHFYLAAGWTGPGTHTNNVVMFWTQAVLLYVWVSVLARGKK